MNHQLDALQHQIRVLEAEILAWHRANPASQRLATVGPTTATAIVATISAAQFRSARESKRGPNPPRGANWPLCWC
jgi:transposase